jgi:hypothetical protein
MQNVALALDRTTIERYLSFSGTVSSSHAGAHGKLPFDDTAELRQLSI